MRKIEINIEDKEPSGMQYFHVLVRQEQGLIVGIGYGSVSKEVMFLYGLQVFNGFREKGIGDEIYFTLENIGKDLGARELQGNFVPESGLRERVLNFYQNRGIRVTEDGRLLKQLI